jgi:FkbM family methyltransferase
MPQRPTGCAGAAYLQQGSRGDKIAVCRGDRIDSFAEPATHKRAFVHMTMAVDDAAIEAGWNNAQPVPPSLPRVTIGMPVFNGMAYIKRATSALLRQSFEDFELIIVDNSSTDGSYEFAQTLTTDPRVRVERNDHNIGAIRNFIKAVDLARGEYFMWAAVDDIWEPEFVARLVAELDANPTAGLAMSAIRSFREDGKTKEVVRFVGAEHPAYLTPLRLALKLGSLQKWSFFIYGLFRRQLLQQAVRYFPEGGAPDRILLAQVALNSGVRYVDEVLYQRQLHQTLHEERYPDEAYSRVVAMGLLGDLHFVWSLCVMLLSSPVVPLRRKLYVPLIGARFGVTRIRARLFPRSTWRERRKALERNLKATERELRKARRQLEGQQGELNIHRDRVSYLEQKHGEKTKRLDEKSRILKRLQKELEKRRAGAEESADGGERYPKFRSFPICGMECRLLCSSSKDVRRIKNIVSDHTATWEWLAQALQSNDIFVDIGAGIGIQTIFAAMHLDPPGAVYAFESHLADVTTLLRNTEANHLGVQVHAACTHLLDRDEVAILPCAPDVPARVDDDAVRMEDAPARSATGALMHACRLDTLIEKRVVPAPTIVAIKAHGLEARVISGMETLLRSPNAPRFVQVWVDPAARGAIVSHMASVGYGPVSGGDEGVREAAEPDGTAASSIVFAARRELAA